MARGTRAFAPAFAAGKRCSDAAACHSHPVAPRPLAAPLQTFKLHQVSATVGLDYDINNKIAEPKWQLESSVGRVLDVQATAAGCTLSKNWDADLGAMSCNVEVRGHCTWSGRVRAASPVKPAPVLACAHAATDCALQPTLSIDFVPIHTVTKAVTGGVAFAVGKSLDVNPRVKLGKLPVKVGLSAACHSPGRVLTRYGSHRSRWAQASTRRAPSSATRRQRMMCSA